MDERRREQLLELLKEAIESYRLAFSQLVQACTLLATADAALLGFGASKNYGPVVVIAGFLPPAGLAVAREFHLRTVPITFFAYKTERALLGDADGFVQAYLFADRGRTLDMYDSILKRFPDDLRQQHLNLREKMGLGIGSPTMISLVSFAAVVQFVLGAWFLAH